MALAKTTSRYNVVVLLSALLSIPVSASSAEVSAEGGIDMRNFFASPAFDRQRDTNPLSVHVSAVIRADHNENQFTAIPYYRHDYVDPERTHSDLRELSWRRTASDWELLLGIGKVFWGVAESHHLVDIINQTDTVEDPDGESKLGQPLANVTLFRDWGTLELYALPYFRERSFPGVEGRLGFALPVDAGSPRYADSRERNHLDTALRYSHYFNGWDLGVSWFSGTDREAALIPDMTTSVLHPYYQQIEQLSLDLQYTQNAWLWKLETLYRRGYSKDMRALVGGLEYSNYQFMGRRGDLGLILEYLYDNRDITDPLTPVSAFNNDLFMGMRYALNDRQDTSILVGTIWDPDSGETLVSLEADRRLGQNLTFAVKGRAFSGSGGVLNNFRSDDYLELQLKVHY
ncbi:hypothetical protein M0G74_06535 [Microbulbifer sp. CAU 1566]|uniref:hypothetical protein n=1 Tax=Microbulbifer sp. CAU 1566 TaxID=2933269 RepID=UPI002004D8B5|nr:hypothetical protein [Microbulbifer sp. CAU 1566]MCK7596927.1 hypothetical protein [Microbulbifer sp. CAU 1566]